MTEQAEDTHEALRAKLRAHIEHRGLSVNEAARGIGMSAPAISSWLGAKYRGDNDRVARLVARWLDTEAEVARMRTTGLDRHAELAVTFRVQGTVGYAHANGDCALVYGASGAGKSWALARYCAEHAGAWFVTMSPAVTTPAAVLSRIARALDVGAGVTTAAKLEDVVVAHLSGRDAVLVVDEAHHLTPALLDQLRCLHDSTGCGLVLSGNDPLWSRLSATERAGQLISRFGVRFRLRRPSETDAIALGEALLRRKPEGRGRERILAAARGLGGLRAIAKLVAFAATLARAEGRADVRDADLVEAAAHMEIGA